MLVLDELVPNDARLVVVAPHPDDELLACGGLLAEHTRRGGTACVIGVTDGEASHRGSDGWTSEALATARRAESDRGLCVLGVTGEAITRLKMPDGAVRRYTAPLREALDMLLGRNDVVTSTWRLDGHPDHEAVGAVTAAVCADIGAVCLQAPVWMWHWSHQGDPTVPWKQMRGFRLSPEVSELKRAALSMHRTQLAARGEGDGAVLDPLILERAARSAEYFFVGA